MRRLVARLASTPDAAQSPAKLPLLHRSLLPFLSLASSLYGFSLFLRRNLYRCGLLRGHRQDECHCSSPSLSVFFLIFRSLIALVSRLGVFLRLPVPVVSVGNLTWGGNGKTPMTEFVARIFLDTGMAPLILTRGYAGGDEAAMLRRHLLNTPARIGLGANRAAVATSFLEKYGYSCCDWLQQKTSTRKEYLTRSSESAIGVIILDDGFQNWSLVRDLDIVMVNGMMPWGNRKLVPRGTLREPLDALKRAGIGVIHHADLVSDIQLKALETAMLNVKKTLPIFFSRLASSCFFDIKDVHTTIPARIIKNMVVLCVSAIGFPSAFSQGIEKIGALHVDQLDFVDHHFIQPEDIMLIRQRLRKLEDKFGTKPLVVVTEKDYDRDTEILKEIREFRVLVVCSSLEIIPFAGRTAEDFKELMKNLLHKENRTCNGGD
ncbi:unnamed protein product [Spirodela intermedia]|uniref:tetraacyldisaccharide 4'-kinase n=1 Tax=Spirodela intermedia TaxID=51605 RepID=A0A7I8KB89_SPIIN|nr:unnamed protein product [Spirodela intermedia]